MTIKIGDQLPAVEFFVKTADGEEKISTAAVFSGRKVVLFAVPGAFTPTCSMNHMPGFIADHDAIKAKGVDVIACTAVNDMHVMKAWAEHTGAVGKIMMLADGNGTFAKACGLDKSSEASGMGQRSRRYSMIVENGIVRALNIEEKPGVNVSGADLVLTQL
jgi:glutaredoxin/glutathione-dependent peroxiredoxin